MLPTPSRRISTPSKKRMPDSTKHTTNVENNIDMRSSDNHDDDVVGISDPYLLMASHNNLNQDGGNSKPNQKKISPISQEHLLIHNQQHDLQHKNQQMMMREEFSSLSSISDLYALHEAHQIGQKQPSNVSIDHSSMLALNQNTQ
jgi:hypothetical protein